MTEISPLKRARKTNQNDENAGQNGYFYRKLRSILCRMQFQFCPLEIFHFSTAIVIVRKSFVFRIHNYKNNGLTNKGVKLLKYNLLLQEIQSLSKEKPLRGIFHAAGVVNDTSLVDLRNGRI